MVIDLSDVPMLDVTVSLAIENAILDALEANVEVYIFSPNRDTTMQLEKFNIRDRLTPLAFCASRELAIERALEVIADPNEAKTER